MHRDLLQSLQRWKNHPLRKPLILRGARQVGKSWLVREFGKDFLSFVELNFERDKRAQPLFNGDLKPQPLLDSLSIYTGQKITPGETLLFLDEVQLCPSALSALRFFKEECPALHVIAAGSLLDFSLYQMEMPVGRVQFLYLYPLSFAEFLTIFHQEALREGMEQLKIDVVSHERLLEWLRLYLWLGGMPAVVDAWEKHRDPKLKREVQEELIQTYSQDFHKYAREKQIPWVTKVFESIPKQLGNKFKYVHVEPDARALHLKGALNLLQKAGIAHLCYHTSAKVKPLGAEKDDKRFKVYFFDVGLAQKMLGQNAQFTDFTALSYAGGMTEQLVAQELVAYQANHTPPALYYWHRESRNSNAEVDFIKDTPNGVVPIEVKAGRTGAMKSLALFQDAHPHTPYAVKISQSPVCESGPLREIPLYALKGWLNKYQIEA